MVTSVDGQLWLLLDRILWAIGVMAGVMANFMCLLGQALMLNDLIKQVSRHCRERLTPSTISCL